MKIREKHIAPSSVYPVGKLLVSFFLILIFGHRPVTASFDFNPNCQQAMQAILDLRFDDAGLMIDEEKARHPENGYAIYLEH